MKDIGFQFMHDPRLLIDTQFITFDADVRFRHADHLPLEKADGGRGVGWVVKTLPMRGCGGFKVGA